MISLKKIKKIDHILTHGNARDANQFLKTITRREKEIPAVRQKIAAIYLKFVNPIKAFRLLENSPTGSPDITLTLANAANFLGASGYALRLLDAVDLKTKTRRGVDVGQILTTNWHDEEGLKWFTNCGSADQPKPSPEADGERRLLLRCYPLLELGRFSEVIAIAKYFLNKGAHTESLQTAYAVMFGAWAATESGLYTDANEFFKLAQRLRQLDDKNWPSALLILVKGIYAAKQGRLSASYRFHQAAFKQLYSKGMQPESGWMTSVYWIGFLAFQKTDRVPEEWARLCFYPTITHSFRTKILAHGRNEISYYLTATGTKQRRGRVHFYLAEQMYAVDGGTKHRMGRGPMYLLALLVIAGPYGIPMFRVIDTLWTAEPLSIKSHGKRLEQFVHRLRKDGFQIHWSDNHLFASGDNDVTVECHSVGSENFGFPFELTDKEFSKADVAQLLQISSRSATRMCANWVASGLVERSGSGPKVKYHRI